MVAPSDVIKHHLTSTVGTTFLSRKFRENFAPLNRRYHTGEFSRQRRRCRINHPYVIRVVHGISTFDNKKFCRILSKKIKNEIFENP